jgi:hypothetical protein
MKHIQTFENYFNEEVQDSSTRINENEIYISNEKFTDEASLKADILKNAGPALESFLRDNGFDWTPGFQIVDDRTRLKLVSKPMKGDDLGIMQSAFAEVYITFFNGGSYPNVNKAAKEAFEFEPSIWCNLNFSWKNHGGGSNGANLILPGQDRSDIWYDVVNAEWLTTDGARNAGF